jgi:hypothetical protein
MRTGRTALPSLASSVARTSAGCGDVTRAIYREWIVQAARQGRPRFTLWRPWPRAFCQEPRPPARWSTPA